MRTIPIFLIEGSSGRNVRYEVDRIKNRRQTMIKNFIYLDEYKMYSLSSQIFEGITEYVLNISQNEENKKSIRKEDYGVLADILKKGYQTEEKKYLHDYSYTGKLKNEIMIDPIAIYTEL